jgi:hypothetical protein
MDSSAYRLALLIQRIAGLALIAGALAFVIAPGWPLLARAFAIWSL